MKFALLATILLCGFIRAADLSTLPRTTQVVVRGYPEHIQRVFLAIQEKLNASERDQTLAALARSLERPYPLQLAPNPQLDDENPATRWQRAFSYRFALSEQRKQIVREDAFLGEFPAELAIIYFLYSRLVDEDSREIHPEDSTWLSVFHQFTRELQEYDGAKLRKTYEDLRAERTRERTRVTLSETTLQTLFSAAATNNARKTEIAASLAAAVKTLPDLRFAFLGNTKFNITHTFPALFDIELFRAAIDRLVETGAITTVDELWEAYSLAHEAGKTVFHKHWGNAPYTLDSEASVLHLIMATDYFKNLGFLARSGRVASLNDLARGATLWIHSSDSRLKDVLDFTQEVYQDALGKATTLSELMTVAEQLDTLLGAWIFEPKFRPNTLFVHVAGQTYYVDDDTKLLAHVNVCLGAVERRFNELHDSMKSGDAREHAVSHGRILSFLRRFVFYFSGINRKNEDGSVNKYVILPREALLTKIIALYLDLRPTERSALDLFQVFVDAGKWSRPYEHDGRRYKRDNGLDWPTVVSLITKIRAACIRDIRHLPSAAAHLEFFKQYFARVKLLPEALHRYLVADEDFVFLKQFLDRNPSAVELHDFISRMDAGDSKAYAPDIYQRLADYAVSASVTLLTREAQAAWKAIVQHPMLRSRVLDATLAQLDAKTQDMPARVSDPTRKSGGALKAICAFLLGWK